ncbi:Sulfate transporter [Nesidiocoris tenuis]|uniref:Sulfate transporter n=1 Tax=Nesidiocoris tenuis TaxID=355587 RepID=A0ABN7AEB5_9HEMI|nr:Sulfate transporter [Nesidiocoris tenuis]
MNALEEEPLIVAERPVRLYAMEECNAKFRIDRNVCVQHSDGIDNDLSKNSFFSFKCQPKTTIKSMFPAIVWLRSYKWKEWLVKDLVAGITVAVMNIPQGMAYALLGNVPPVVGIYMALFPVLVYALLGTSHHVSMGSFAVVCLMTGNVVSKYSPPTESIVNEIANNSSLNTDYYTPIQVATAVAFLVGIYQLIMYVFQFGLLCSLLSEHLVSGFTAGAAVHVLTSQLKDIFGIKITPYSGPLKLVYIYGELFSKLYTVNLAAVVVSAITMIVMIANNEYLKPLVAKKCIFPVPIELIVVLCGTLASTYGNIATTYGLKVVGDIPIGLPEPELPKFDLMPSIAVDALTIAIIAYVISLSMALIFANKLKYEVDPNQELFAQGWGNIVGSMFSCLPFAASLSRSAVQQSVGGCTQLTSVFSATILTFVLLCVAPFFELLPRCILASLIVVALKGILFQAADIVGIWKISSLEAIIWLTTYLSVVIIDIDYGLAVGLAASVIILFVRGAQLQVIVLERLSNTEIFLEAGKFMKTEKIPDFTVIHYTGCVNFVNKSTFQRKTLETVFGRNNITSTSKIVPQDIVKETVILDFRSITYIDSTGAKTLKSVIEDLDNRNKRVSLVGLTGPSIQMLRSCGVFKGHSLTIFPTPQDAVVYSQYMSGNNVYNIRL